MYTYYTKPPKKSMISNQFLSHPPFMWGISMGISHLCSMLQQ